MSGNNSYSDLVIQVLKVPALAEAVNRMTESHRTLNLVDTEWKKHLTNSLTYQEFNVNAAKCFRPSVAKSSKFTVHRIKSPVPIKIMLVFQGFYLYDEKNKKSSIRVVVSEPLEEWCKVMTKDKVENDFKISTEFRFYMDSCNPLTCHVCYSSYNHFKSKGCKLSTEGNPCIQNTLIYDGKHVLNRFVSQMKDNVLRNFLGIAKFEINSRYFYTSTDDAHREVQWVRLGGNITELLAFSESKLKQMDLSNIVLGDFNFLMEEESESKNHQTNNPQPSTSQSKEDEEEFMRENQLMDSFEDSASLKRAAESSDDDESIIEALPSHFKRPRLEHDEPKNSVEETLMFLE